jgi:hypothetical protein
MAIDETSDKEDEDPGLSSDEILRAVNRGAYKAQKRHKERGSI